MKLVFVHGWGFSPKFWQNVTARITGHDIEFVDLGFFGSTQNANSKDAIVIGHSMGLAWALENLNPINWRGAIGINSFTRFCRDADFPSGQMPRVLDRMITRFNDAPLLVAQDFLARCGVAEIQWPQFDQSKLADGLVWLREMDQRTAFANLKIPFKALAAKDDAIVPPSMSQDCFAQNYLEIFAGGDHVLPLSAPQWVADHIMKFASELQ